LTDVKRLVLDVLKPHEPNTIELSEQIISVEGVDFVNTLSEEVDQETESLKITIEGDRLNFPDIKSIIEDCGGAVHSIDEVTVSQRGNARSRKKQKVISK
jgi:hypothetical protein